MILLDYLHTVMGERVTAPGGLGGECVDLANCYLHEVLHRQPVRLNAVDWKSAYIPGFTWVENTPTNMPPFGALVVWGEYAPLGIGLNGHIAINLVADVMTFVAAQQNYPEESAVNLWMHSYAGVLGWQKPT